METLGTVHHREGIVKDTDERIDGYIYVLKAGDYYKIGRTKHPNNRIKALKIQLPFPVEVYALIPCWDHVDAEDHAHYTFNDLRANGEWFHIPDEAQISWMREVIIATRDDVCSEWVFADRSRE